jgi:hypothetical protein
MTPRLTLLLLTTAALAACGGSDDDHAPWNAHLPTELRDGKWKRGSGNRMPQLTEEQRRAIETLNAIGYADGVREAPALVSVTLHDRERATAGYNFYTSGHDTEAYLVDMEGELLHTWRYEYGLLWPDLDVPADAAGRGKWRRAHLFPNGDILAIHEGIGMIRLDRSSKLLWEYPGRAHHDMHVLEDGTIWTLTREAAVIERIDPDVPSMDDFLVQLTGDGQELRRISVLECIENGGVEELLERIPDSMELFHTNSIEVLDGRAADRHPAFAAGNILTSMRHLDAIAVMDPAKQAVVWWMVGDFEAQHHPTILDNGNLLLFDNLGAGRASTVYEYDLATGDVVWTYRGSEQEPFFSKTCGSTYRLPTGNTLITESDGGRSLEVTPGGDIVWEFFNPHRGGPDLEYIACLFDLVRVDPAEVAWLPAKGEDD